MCETDTILARAWLLGNEDPSDEIDDEFEAMLPALVAAGYAETDGHTWNFTHKGAVAAEELVPERHRLELAARFDPPEARRQFEEWKAVNAEVLASVPQDRIFLDAGRASGDDFFRIWLPEEVAPRCRDPK